MYTGDKTTDERVASKLPQPQGYKILIGVPEISEKTEGGVFMPDGLKSAEETASIIGFVMKLGPDAYNDESKFPERRLLQRRRLRDLPLVLGHPPSRFNGKRVF
jgi:hypothetical protein